MQIKQITLVAEGRIDSQFTKKTLAAGRDGIAKLAWRKDSRGVSATLEDGRKVEVPASNIATVEYE